MSSASSAPRKSFSALSSHTQDSELPLSPCKIFKATVRELTSIVEASQGQKFYRCVNTTKVGNFSLFCLIGKLRGSIDAFLRCKDTGKQCEFFMWQGPYAIWLIKSGFVTETTEVVLQAALDEQKACIKEIKTHMFELQDGVKQMVSALKLMHAELDKLKGEAKPRNRNVCSIFVAVIIFFVAMFYGM